MGWGDGEGYDWDNEEVSDICAVGFEVKLRRLMHLVPAPAVRLMKSRVESSPGQD